MSPTTRRGRAVPASQHKSPARGASTASRKPAAAVEQGEQLDDEQLDNVDPKAKVRVKGGAAKAGAVKATPVRRQGWLSRLRKNSAYRYASEAFGAYLPLLLVFVLLFSGVWVWISFGPHPPTAQDNWKTAETAWLQKRTDARQQIIGAGTNFTTQLAGYTALRDDTKGWMTDLGKITSGGWDGPNPSIATGRASLNSDLVNAFISAGDNELTTLDSMIAAKTADDLAILGNTIVTDEQGFEAAYADARSQIMGVTVSASGEPTLAIPSLCPGVGPSASASDSAGALGSPSASPSPSAGAAASPDVCASAAASASAAAEASASPTPTATPGLSGSPSPSISAKP